MSPKHMYNMTLQNKKIPLRKKERNKRPRLSYDVVHFHISRFQMAPEGHLTRTSHSILQSCSVWRRSIPFPKGKEHAFTLLLWMKTGWEKHMFR